ncbi:hypothetical protein FB192DRAFT_1379802 [Mucor lusitanicus]|uniref:Uncharacterized protein n=2 Tax=Mucor circinelloides f. lusitanicus TaxID=29924 RepID=A0A168I009_MUCCL|nr:hypothetical protein FB192DRAFT_1379802 [Mucor lusitanicus]OAC99393.1 hypothetical protein MUCCIDRAFT_114581 [Mucor lusitanicus CBS 277.49]
MLEQDAYAWLAFSFSFGFIALVLLLQSIHHWHILPFAIYALFIMIGHLYIAITPYFSQPNIPWSDQEPIITQLPAISILAFAGIVDWQVVYVRFINTASKNYRRWGSLHPVNMIDEKSDEDSMSDTSTVVFQLPSEYHHTNYIEAITSTTATPFLLSAFAIWIYISAIIIYGVATLAFVVCKTTIADAQISALISAICMTIMASFTLFNAIAVVYTGSTCHSKEIAWIMGQNRRDAVILFLMPLLFMVAMTSATAISWTAYKQTTDPAIKPFATILDSGDQDVAKWIILKSFAVYLPLIILLICCSLKRKKSKLTVDEHQKILTHQSNTLINKSCVNQ